MSAAVSRGLRPIAALVAAVSLFAPGDRARADDPFAFTARTTSGTPQTVRVSGSSLPDLADDLVRTQSQFLALQGQAFDASLRYGGLSNAVRYSQNAAGTSATLAIPSTGFSRTFTGANEDDLRDQIEDFLREDGADEYARFLREVNQRTVIGVTDGNPLATTALLSDLAFDRFGLQFRPMLAPEHPNRLTGGFDLDVRGGFNEAGDTDGWFGTAVLASEFRINDGVALTVGSLFNYRDVEGASVYNVGGVAGLPIQMLFARGRTQNMSWQLTPFFVGGAGGSVDLASGGTFLGGGLSSSFSIRAAPFTFILGNQISFYEGFPIDVGEFDFETDLSQQVLKNGLRVAYEVNSGFLIDVGVTYTNFLNEAAVDAYLTPSAGVLFRTGENSGIRLGYRGDFGDDYAAHGGGASLFINQ